MHNLDLSVAGWAVRVGVVLEEGVVRRPRGESLLEKQIPPLRCGMTARKARATATTGVLRFAQDDGNCCGAESSFGVDRRVEAMGSGCAISRVAVLA